MSGVTLAPPSAMRSVLLVTRGVWIETIRRKEFYVLLILMGLFVAGAFVVKMIGTEGPSTSNFLLNLGLSLAVYAAHLLALLSAARQVPTDIDARTLYPILAKPVSRGQYLLGKWLASTTSACVALCVLALLTELIQIVLPPGHPLDMRTLFQAIPLLFFSIALLAAMALFGSLVMPQGVNLVAVGLIYFSGEQIVSFIRARFSGSPGDDAIRWVTAYLPSFDHLNLVTRYTDGIGPVPAEDYAGLMLYALITAGFFLSLAITLFKRRPL